MNTGVGWSARPFDEGKCMNAKKTCGKRRFPDEYAAGKRLKRNQERASRNGYRAPLRYYLHDGPGGCDGFHLTSQPDKEKTVERYWFIEGSQQHQPRDDPAGREQLDEAAGPGCGEGDGRPDPVPRGAVEVS